MRALVLRLDTPMMSFGGVMVDKHGFSERFPGTAMLTGMFGNALGWQHGDFDRLQSLQQRIEYAARWDVRPEPLIDYQTVDLGQPKMVGYADRQKSNDPVGGWTTRGRPERRAGGPSAEFCTHQRYRHYWTDGLLTVVVGLKDGRGPDLDTIKEALRRPARPLFLGRKTCLPARPLLDPETPIAEGDNLLAILRKVPAWGRDGMPVSNGEKLMACWPAKFGLEGRGEIRRVYDLRDWVNQIPAGSRGRAEGLIGAEGL